jgi:putative phage-type endonuclease
MSDIVQGSPEWFAMRHGNASASRIADIIAKTKSGYSASRENYLTELVLERFGIPQDSFTSAAMEWGTLTEPLARMAYEAATGDFVKEVGYILHNTIERSGASPDGLVGDDGLLEIKCPISKTHFEYLLAGEVPSKYKPQMAWQMACTGRKWCDFVSFDPRVPERLQYFQVRYHRDNEYIEMLETEVKQFLIEVAAKFKQLQDKVDAWECVSPT